MISSPNRSKLSETALVIVDVQNDFCSSAGSLPVPQAKTLIPIINRVRTAFSTVILTQDWHPRGHISFSSSHPNHSPFETIRVTDGFGESRFQTLWPDHCVQSTWGAEFVKELTIDYAQDTVIRKGSRHDVDSYSAFMDESGRSTGMAEALRERHIEQILLCGVALDFCVGRTALDAVAEGFDTLIISDCTRGIDEKGCAAMKARLLEHGVRWIDHGRAMKIGRVAFQS